MLLSFATNVESCEAHDQQQNAVNTDTVLAHYYLILECLLWAGVVSTTPVLPLGTVFYQPSLLNAVHRRSWLSRNSSRLSYFVSLRSCRAQCIRDNFIA
jgi:hypothetical protein